MADNIFLLFPCLLFLCQANVTSCPGTTKFCDEEMQDRIANNSIA